MVRRLQEINRTLILPDIGSVFPATLFLEFFAARPHLCAHARGCSAAVQFRIPGAEADKVIPLWSRYSFGVYSNAKWGHHKPGPGFFPPPRPPAPPEAIHKNERISEFV